MKFVLIVLAIIGVLMVAASAFVVFLFSGGSGAWDVWRRGYESTEEVLIGHTVRMKVPKGFRADGYQYLAELPRGNAFPHAINDSSVQFHASLGAYTGEGRPGWAARVYAEFAAPGVTALPASKGFVAEQPGRRVRVEADPKVYNASQCQQIADAALASLQADPQQIAAFFERRKEHLAAQPANRKAGWDILETRGFKPLPSADGIPMRQVDGHVMYLHGDRNHAVVWYKIAVIPVDAFDSLREDFAQTKRYLKQENSVSGLMLTLRKDEGLLRYRLATSASPVPAKGEEDPLTPLLLQETPMGSTVLWRTFSMLDFANRGGVPLKEWFEDSDRIRSASTAVWRRN